MDDVASWFGAFDDVPLRHPPTLRPHAPASDDPDRRELGRAVARVSGLALGIEYCDARGWMSARAIRCLTLDTDHPPAIVADCQVRDEPRTFRLDRIITALNYRTGAVLSDDEYQLLLGSYLPNAALRPWMRPLFLAQAATRDGVFALLHVAMRSGRLSVDARDVVVDYALRESAACELPLASPELVRLWVENLVPSRDAVLGAVERLLEDRERFVRFLPFVLQVCRTDGSDIGGSVLRDLMRRVREHFSNPVKSAAANG